jgi:hypothetical protein
MNWLKGKRTYLTMVVIIALSAINGWNEYCATEGAAGFCVNVSIPEYAYAILGTLGIYTRSLANK